MVAFPEDFPGLLIPVAILEGVAGILKGKFQNKMFWTALALEIICTAIKVSCGSYSRLKTAAAYSTVMFDALLLLIEVLLVMQMLNKTNPDIGGFGFVTGCCKFVTAVILGLSGLPFFG